MITCLPPCLTLLLLLLLLLLCPPLQQAAYPWSSSKVILDVGGGRGELLSAAMSWAAPDARGLLLDVDMVIKR
jgi:hypothetical protein